MVKFNRFKNTSFVPASLVAIAFLAIGSVSTNLLAAPEGHKDYCKRGQFEGHHGHPAGFVPLPDLLWQLDLSAEQKDKVFNITYTQIPEVREHHKQHQTLIKELVTLTQADQFDDKKAQALAEKLATLEKQKALGHARTDAKLYALLTPEQKIKLKSIIENAKLNKPDEGFLLKGGPVNFKHNHFGHHDSKAM